MILAHLATAVMALAWTGAAALLVLGWARDRAVRRRSGPLVGEAAENDREPSPRKEAAHAPALTRYLDTSNEVGEVVPVAPGELERMAAEARRLHRSWPGPVLPDAAPCRCARCGTPVPDTEYRCACGYPRDGRGYADAALSALARREAQREVIALTPAGREAAR